MANRAVLGLLALVLCCTAVSGIRDLKQAAAPGAATPLLGRGPPTVQPADDEDPFADAPTALTPVGAPVSSQSLPGAPAAAPSPANGAPLGGPGSCYVDWNAQVQQQSAGSSSSFSGPACVIVDRGLTPDQCRAQATAANRAYVPSADPACSYPVAQDCQSLTSQFPGLTACPADITQATQKAAQAKTFDSALTTNMANAPSPPPLFSGSLFSPANFGSNFPSLGNFPSLDGLSGR